MRHGFLSGCLAGVAAKRLTAAEAAGDADRHGLDGAEPLRHLLGSEGFPSRPATFVWLGDRSQGFTECSSLAWQAAGEGGPERAEWRLCYPENLVMEQAREGDLLVVACPPGRDGNVTVVVAEERSTFENQLVWLFGLDRALDETFVVERFANGKDRELNFASLHILDQLAIAVEEPESELLDRLSGPFRDGIPSAPRFSRYARDNLPGEVSVRDDPDAALMLWMEWERKLSVRCEEGDIQKILSAIEAADSLLDEFVEQAESFFQRRESHVEHALENHLEEILAGNQIRYARDAGTERGKPVFLFPGLEEYRDPDFPARDLLVLGTRASCQDDRWAEMLYEARPAGGKYLLTLEAGIAKWRTDGMRREGLRLVVPRALHETYREERRDGLMSVREFVEFLRGRQGVDG